MYVYDRYVTGEKQSCIIYSRQHPFSMYSYVQACPSMKINDWVDCHIQAYRYFGGVTRLLIPDNLKVGIIPKQKYEDPILNKSYQEMAEAIMIQLLFPTRVRSLKIRQLLKARVGDCTVAIVGKLRKQGKILFVLRT